MLILQGFCKQLKRSEIYVASLTRKRSVIRIHYRPLETSSDLQVKRRV
jgi:hypothetical protein